jgi:PAT family beta-lactamase induction signal transducer AmpG
LPYAVVTAVSLLLYKDIHVSNPEITRISSWLAVPWMLKPIWSPAVEALQTRRRWIWGMQLIFAVSIAAIVFTLPSDHFMLWSLVFFCLTAFASATHDIAADGFYLLANSEDEQSFFSGVRNTFYRLATIFAGGLLLLLAGRVGKQTGNVTLGWQIAFGVVSGTVAILAVYHFVMLPRPTRDVPGDIHTIGKFWREFFGTFGSFFRKPKIGLMLLFLLFYRFGEAQLTKMVPLFLRDPREEGGLGLFTDDVGLVYGTIGVAALLAGGIAGGILVSRRGLRVWLWPMVFVMHVPDVAFVYLSRVQPTSLVTISTCVALEQFGYGFGFTAYMLYMIYIARGPHQTAHYAICTGFMTLGALLPGRWSGELQHFLGYQHFFIWVLLATIPGFIVTALIPLDAEFGRKRNRD